MSGSYKWVGGVGYLLSLMPPINLVSWIVVAIAWILTGRNTRKKIFTATGALILVSTISGASLIAASFVVLPASLALLLQSRFGAAPAQLIQDMGQLLVVFGPLALIMVTSAIAALVLEIASHFQAGKLFKNTWFKLAGLLRVATIAATAALIILLAQLMLGMFNVIARMTSLLASIVSGLADPLALLEIIRSLPPMITETLLEALSLCVPMAVIAVLNMALATFSLIFSSIAFLAITEHKT